MQNNFFCPKPLAVEPLAVSSSQSLFLSGSPNAIDQPYIAKAKEKNAGTSANIPNE